MGSRVTRRSRGFTLIEVLIVMSIIAILALMTIPTFQERRVREQVVEGAKLADVAKGPIATSWASARRLPRDNAEAGLPVAEKIVGTLVQSVTVEDGAIHVRYGNDVHPALRGRTLTLRPAVVEDAPVVPVAWVCAQGRPPEQMAAHGPDRTDIEARYLPLNCRSR